MTTTLKQRCTASLTAFLLSGIAGLVPSLKAGEESESVSKLLAEAKRQSYAVSVDASTLESYTRQPSLSWQSHAAEINRMKDDITAAGKTLAALNAAKGQAAAWQATAIDRIIPYMREIADDTTNAIEYLNKNQSRPLTMGDYKDFIEANSDTSRELASLIANFVDYGNHKSRYEGLKKSLELPAK